MTRLVSISIRTGKSHPFTRLCLLFIQKLESTDEEPSISQDQLSEELSKLIQGKYSSQGILTWAPEKKPPRKTPQPEAQSSSPEGPASANLEGRTSSQLCAGDETVQPPAAEPQAAEEDEDEALGSSVEEDYITVEELQEELSRLLEGNHSSQEMISWLQVSLPRCSTSGSGCRRLTAPLFRRPSTTTTCPLTTSWRC